MCGVVKNSDTATRRRPTLLNTAERIWARATRDSAEEAHNVTQSMDQRAVNPVHDLANSQRFG